MQVVSTKREEVPHCFAKDWDKNSPECAGGKDPTYTHPLTGMSVRDQCTFFGPCGARTQAAKMANVIPPSQLVRPGVVTPAPGPAPSPSSFGDYLRQKAIESADAQRVAAMSQMRPAIPTQGPQMPWTAPQQQAHHPGDVWQLNYGMPAYLTVPEQRYPGEGLQSVLLREILRSVFKALGHAIAHFFDARRIKESN